MGHINNRVTIVDVAKAADVSISTVSRVMNGNYPVKEELIERVNKAVERLEYIPDSIARGMKAKRRYSIGYVISDITNRHFTVISKTIEAKLGLLGFSLIVSSTDSDREKEIRAIKMLLSHRVDGLIINTSGENDAYISSISQSLPVVLLHRRIGAKGFVGDYVGSNNYEACARLAKHAYEMGHRQIGLITSDYSISTFRERTNGFLETLASFGLAIPSDRIVVTPYTEEGGYAAVKRLVESHPELTLVAVMNNATMLGALKYVHEYKVAVPQSLSLMSFGDILNSDLLFVRPSFMTQQPNEVGKWVAKLILDRLDTPSAKPREVIVEAKFEIGESVSRL